MATSYYFRRLQRVGLLRGREKMVYWCMPLFLPCFLSSFYHFLSFFLSIRSFTFSFLLFSCRGLFHIWSFLFLDLSLGDFLFLSASLRCFSLHWVPLFTMVTFSFYSELIQWNFSFLPLGLHQLFLACFGHPFRTTHQPIGCLATSAAPWLISWQNSLLFILAVYLYL